MRPVNDDSPETPTSDGLDPSEYAVPDIVLELLVTVVNKAEFDIGVTLTVGGLMVSGQLTGRDRYAKRVTQSLRTVTGSGKPIADAVAEGLFASSDEDDEADDEKPPPLYIHLTDVSISSSAQGHVEFDAWRGKLASVDGWAFGARKRVT